MEVKKAMSKEFTPITAHNLSTLFDKSQLEGYFLDPLSDDQWQAVRSIAKREAEYLLTSLLTTINLSIVAGSDQDTLKLATVKKMLEETLETLREDM